MYILTIPNILTMARIVLIPVFVSALMYQRYDFSLLIFTVAALTDLLDGMIARAKNQQTELGRFLDPVADKFLLVTSFVLLAIYGFVPKWLSIVVISRDVIIITGWLIVFFITHRAKVEPSFLGKISNAMQLTLVAYILLYINLNRGYLPEPKPLEIFTALLTVVSGLQYLYRGLKQMGGSDG